ncbi:MAG: hypothetical protein WDZ35_10585 [Crocinitomicaceae bacterium]
MKLLSKKGLQISEEDAKTTFRWWAMNFVEIILVFWLPISFIWGMGSYYNYEEIIGIKVLPMGTKATLIYWSTAGLIFIHMIFNRFVVLEISPEHLKYKRRFFLGVSRKIDIKNIVEIRIKEKADNISESPPDGRDLTSYSLLIRSVDKKKLQIKGLSKSDIEIIQNKIIEYKSAK